MLVTRFCQDLKEAVNGGKSQRILSQSNRRHYENFKRGIHATAPDFRPFEDLEKYNKPHYSSTVSGYDDNPMNPDPRVKVYGLKDVREVIRR
jgi:hypothetical protein